MKAVSENENTDVMGKIKGFAVRQSRVSPYVTK